MKGSTPWRKGRLPRSTASSARPLLAGRRAGVTAWFRRALQSVFFVVLAVGLGGTASGRAADARHTVVFFGDSLTAGYGLDDPAADAYPAVIQRKIDAEHLPWRVVNAGLSGETSAAGSRRVDWILRQPVDIFVLALGANDGLRGIDPDVTARNLDEIIAHVRAKDPSARIVVAGMKMPGSMGAAYTQRFDELFAKVAERNHVTLLPFLLEGVAGRPELNQADSIHPTPAGHRLVAENVWKILRPLL